MAEKPPKPTSYAKNTAKGISSWFDTSNTRNFLTDMGRNTGNLAGSIGNFLASRDAPKFGAGDRLFGTPTPAPRPASKGFSSGGSFGSDPTPPPAEQQGPVGSQKVFLDYLNEAKGLGLGGDNSANFDALSGQLRVNGSQGDAKLQAMYDQLQRSIAAEAPAIQQNFAGTGASIAKNAADANSMVQQSYGATRDAQTKQLAALGIGDAAGVLASNGGLAARDQSMASSSIAQNQQAALDSNAAHSASAVQYNTGVGNAAQLAGTEARSALQRQLSTKLAELESAKASSKTDGASKAFSAAVQLMQMDPTSAANIAKGQQGAISNELGNQKTASEIAYNQARAGAAAGGSKQTIQEAIAGTGGGYKSLHDAFIKGGGTDDSAGKNFATFVATMKSVNGIK